MSDTWTSKFNSEAKTILVQDSAFSDLKEDRRHGMEKPSGIPFPNSEHAFNRIRRKKEIKPPRMVAIICSVWWINGKVPL